jgi:hypothetical protein
MRETSIQVIIASEEKMKRIIFPLIVFVVSMFGCADTHHIVRSSPVGASSKFGAGDSFYIAVSRDGVYDSKVYRGSGVMTTQILRSSFIKRVQKIQLDRSYRPFDKSLLEAKQANYKYLVYPTILEWEDRATEWSGRPDRASINVDIVDVTSGQTVESVVINGKSGLATLGGDHPQDLLPIPVEEFVSTLFSQGTPPE